MMSTDLKHEFQRNIRFFRFSLLVTALTLAPQFILSQSLQHGITLLFAAILLILVSKISKTAYALFVVYLLVINIFQLHISVHWGGDTDDLSSRVAVALISPTYETQEYLSEFIDYRDALALLYNAAVFLLLLKFLFHSNHDYQRIRKYALVISLFIFLILQNQQPFKLFKNYLDISARSEILEQRHAFLANHKPARRDNFTPLYDKIVIIIGEAANRDFMGVYGHSPDTTPFLSSLSRSANLLMNPAIAPSNQTRFAIPMLLTGAEVDAWQQKFTTSASILADFSSNGYRTYWISNQGRSGEHEDFITSIALEANAAVFLHESRYISSGRDMAILDYLQHHTPGDDREVFVFHLLGSHVSYSQRYDHDNALHQPATDIVQQYENSIYYTDHVLEGIFNHFNQPNVKLLMIYTSDHGELVSNDKYGHGYSPAYREEYDAPLVIYSSVANKRTSYLQAHLQDQAVNTQSLNTILLYLSGLSDDPDISFSRTISVISPGNTMPYDKLNSLR